VTDAPLAACVVSTVLVADQEPQGERSQLAIVQVTPAFVGSLVTTAVTGAVALISTPLGGAWVMLTLIGPDITKVVEALKV
jgi:hypothetical protein